MPKIIDYPKTSLRRGFVLADAVEKLGGEASMHSVAEALGNKVSGSFKTWVGGTAKYGLVTNSRGRLGVQPLYKDYKLAYSPAHQMEAVRKAFMNLQLFNELANRLNGQALPQHLDRILIREYAVPEDVASRVVQYFIEGAKEAGVLNPTTGLISANPMSVGTDSRITPGTAVVAFGREPTMAPPTDEDFADLMGLPDAVPVPQNAALYSVRITGPGIDTKIAIKEDEDLEIVEVTLRKIRRLLAADRERVSND